MKEAGKTWIEISWLGQDRGRGGGGGGEGWNSHNGSVLGWLSCLMQRGGLVLSWIPCSEGRSFSLGVNMGSDSIPPKLLDESINRSLVCAHMHYSIERSQQILTSMS